MTKVAHLYKITNIITGEYYIGKHNGWTQNGYWGSGNRIKKQVKKYGDENFTYKILVIGNTDYIFELERKIVTVNLIESDEKCLNLRVGGEGFAEHTKSAIDKISKSLKDVYSKPETRKKVSDGVKKYFANNPHIREEIVKKLRGRKVSKETKQKLSEVQKLNYINNPERKEKFSKTMSGRNISEEHKQKISSGNLGKIRTEEMKQKISAARVKQIIPKEAYEKSSKTMSTLTWMNDGTRSYRIRPENIQAAKNKGYVDGRLRDYINNEYKEKLKMTTSNQWQKVKSTGHTGLLVKVQS